MPAVIEEGAAAAPVRARMERDSYTNSRISNAPPIHDDAVMRTARQHDRAGDERFVAALVPALAPRRGSAPRRCGSQTATWRRGCWGSHRRPAAASR